MTDAEIIAALRQAVEQAAKSGRELVSLPSAPPSLSVGIAKLSLRPGDVVLVKLAGSIPPIEYEIVYESIAKVLPAGVKALVLRSEDELTVLRAGQPVKPEVDEAIVCEVKR